MDAIRNRIEALVGSSTKLDDLLEQLIAASRQATVEDIKIDLGNFGESEAVAIIEANY